MATLVPPLLAPNTVHNKSATDPAADCRTPAGVLRVLRTGVSRRCGWSAQVTGLPAHGARA